SFSSSFPSRSGDLEANPQLLLPYLLRLLQSRPRLEQPKRASQKIRMRPSTVSSLCYLPKSNFIYVNSILASDISKYPQKCKPKTVRMLGAEQVPPAPHLMEGRGGPFAEFPPIFRSDGGGRPKNGGG